MAASVRLQADAGGAPSEHTLCTPPFRDTCWSGRWRSAATVSALHHTMKSCVEGGRRSRPGNERRFMALYHNH